MPGTRARLRYLRTSPSKVRQVLGLIRGLEVEEARAQLELCTRGPALDVRKLLDSAIANAEHNDNLPEDELFVSHAYADDGPTLKRWRPRARGRGTRIRKRTSHVTIVVSRFSDEELERRRRREASAPARKRRPPRIRRPPREVEHDHDEELEDTEEPEAGGDEKVEDERDAATPAQRSPAKKAPAKKGAAKKTTAKKTAKKTTARTRKRD
jgi:large subunit ribosomal protein L22